MDRIKIDLLRAKYDLGTPEKRGVFLFTRIFLAMTIVVAVAGVAFSYGSSSTDGGTVGFLSSLARLVGSGDKLLRGEADDRINFLILGVGGAGHEGAELADTIIFSSFRPSTNQVGMISIPRDLFVPVPGYEGWRKVNSVNAYAEAKQDGQGGPATADVLGDVFAQEIQYYVKIDFRGFESFIDELGGVNVYVDRAFTDGQYPILGMEEADCGTSVTVEGEDGEEITVPSYSCRYEVLQFEEGWQHMDGATALKFARSRKGSNGEGSDFARAARQQKILLAVKGELLSGATLLNPGRIAKLFETVKSNINTNLTIGELIRLATFLPQIDDKTITHHVLNDPSLVSEQSLNGVYALLPANNDWHPIQQLTANIFNADAANLALGSPEETPRQYAKIEIQNGTSVVGLGSQTSAFLVSQGF